MFHTHPASKVTTANGYKEGYKLKEINSVSLDRLIYSGGFDDIGASTQDRLFIVVKGTGFATIMGKTVEFPEGSVLELPAGQSMELSSAQVIFHVVTVNK